MRYNTRMTKRLIKSGPHYSIVPHRERPAWMPFPMALPASRSLSSILSVQAATLPRAVREKWPKEFPMAPELPKPLAISKI